MNIQSLDNLNTIKIELDFIEYEIFDLSNDSFNLINASFNPYIIESSNEMRLDNISSELYQTSDDLDTLMYLNDIINPFKIKENDVILYPSADAIDGFRKSLSDGDSIRETISANRIKKKVDKNRSDEISLPPTINSSNYNPIDVNDGRIVIGKGILDI